jgi:hypothetical protein
MKVIIDTKTWHRGQNFGYNTSLLNKDGNKCCLGFLGSACGIEDNYLLNKAYPSGVNREHITNAYLEGDNYSKFPKLKELSWNDFTIINDEQKLLSDEERQECLIEMFKNEFDMDLVFK